MYRQIENFKNGCSADMGAINAEAKRLDKLLADAGFAIEADICVALENACISNNINEYTINVVGSLRNAIIMRLADLETVKASKLSSLIDRLPLPKFIIED